MISDADSEQNAQIARIDEACRSLGRSIDQVRDKFNDHETRCQENWREQKESNGAINQKLKLILWVFGTLATIAGGVAAEHIWSLINA